MAGLEGSLRPIASQIQAKTGASAITKIGCTLWNQLAGKAKPKMVQSVPRSANRLSEEPACSKAAQKSAEEMNSTRMAALRLRSTGDQLPKKISQEKTTTEMPSRHQPCAVGDHGGVDFHHAAHAERGQNRHHRRADAEAANRTLLLAQILLEIAGGGRMQARRAQVPAGHQVLDESGEHAESGHAEAEAPADALADVAADQRRNQRADIDPHVEDGKAGVAARIALVRTTGRRWC